MKNLGCQGSLESGKAIFIATPHSRSAAQRPAQASAVSSAERNRAVSELVELHVEAYSPA